MPLTRRQFLKGLGLTAGGLGMGAAGYDRLIPYVVQPEDIVPGHATWYATSCRECPAGCGLLLRNRESRVVKCEGNPQHPINRGALCSRGQAALHGLYDPDRIKSPLRRNSSGNFESVTWDRTLAAVAAPFAATRSAQERVAVISDLQTGSLEALMRVWLATMGAGRLLVYEPVSYEAVKAANGGVVPSYDIARSDFLISFGADFLETWVSPVEFAVQFARFREAKNGTRGRFVYVGPRVSMTAANADIRLIVPPGAMGEVATAIRTPDGASVGVARKYGLDPADLRAASEWLAAASAPLALPGWDEDSASAAALIRGPAGSAVGNQGRPHAVTSIASRAEIARLIEDMESGAVDTLMVSGANPAYGLPAAARFVEAAKRVPRIISLSSYMDETTKLAHWVLPSNTPLESWGDYRPYPDVANLMQPVMGTLHDTRHTGDILIEIARAAGVSPAAAFRADTFLDYLKLRWGAAQTGDALDERWVTRVQRGGSWGAAAGAAVAPAAPAAAPLAVGAPWLVENEGEVRLWAFPQTYLYDGRGANRWWLQEMPEPVTKGLWGTWAELHPDTARRLGVNTDDMVEISRAGAKITVPAYVWRGVAPDTVAVPIGEGHTEYGRFAKGIGANVLKLTGPGGVAVQARSAGSAKWAARIKSHMDQHGREIVQTVALGKPPEHSHELTMPMPEGYGKKDFYPSHKHPVHRWAMVVDLDRCIGCNACVTACYAENNIAVVGPDAIWRRREMAWLRIDTYIDWRERSAPILFQPMLCQHCDSAPCEPVCPVFAAAHSDEGINMQVYNRCVGTRYCSNNCPYKVRRFNWFDHEWPKPLNYQLNPDVTVRCRGVMEKCTFCIQRIRAAEIAARAERRPLRDGEIQPACAQTCPTGAYTFGDLKDPDSRVSRIIREDPRAYQVLHELNTKPGVIYLKRIVEEV